MVGNAKSSTIDLSGGISSLSQNPLSLEIIASSSLHSGDINLWNADPANWQGDDKLIEGTLKRQRTGIKTVDPFATIKSVSGTSALKWITNDSIVTGSVDH